MNKEIWTKNIFKLFLCSGSKFYAITNIHFKINANVKYYK